MAGSVNKVILVGNLGKDPEVRTFSNGGRVCNLTIATSESWKDKASGERKERTEWHRVVVMSDGLVGVCERYLKKGAKVYIEGQLETRKYEKDGRDVYTTEVVLRPFSSALEMLDSKGGGSSASAPSNDYGDSSYSGGSAQASGGSFGAAPKSDMDDEIPF